MHIRAGNSQLDPIILWVVLQQEAQRQVLPIRDPFRLHKRGKRPVGAKLVDPFVDDTMGGELA